MSSMESLKHLNRKFRVREIGVFGSYVGREAKEDGVIRKAKLWKGLGLIYNLIHQTI